MAYWVRAGCAWRLLPHDLPPWQTIYHYFRSWRQQGMWEQIHRVLHVQERTRQGRRPTPARRSWTARASRLTTGGRHGYDGAKKVNSRKRYLLVDTLGLVCKVQVTAADVGDRDGAMALLRRLDRRRFSRLQHGWVDGGYRGPFLDWALHGGLHRGVPVAIPDLRADGRFDQIAFALRSAGIRGALCVPVEVLGGPIGTLDLFTAIPRAWDDSEVAAAHAYAGVVTSLLGSAVAAHASSRLAAQLQTALDSRVLIEQAKGVLMASEKVDAQ
jgi:transposase